MSLGVREGAPPTPPSKVPVKSGYLRPDRTQGSHPGLTPWVVTPLAVRRVLGGVPWGVGVLCWAGVEKLIR